MTLHEALLNVKAMVDSDWVIFERLGICQIIKIGGDSRETWTAHCLEMEELFKQWPKYSGNLSFPVPDPDGEMRPGLIFAKHELQRTMWVGAYGALRRELLDYMIEETRPR